MCESPFTKQIKVDISVFSPKAHRFPAAGIPVKRERFEAADLPLTRQTRKESESETRGKWKKPIHNCPWGSCKVKSVVGLAKEKVIGFRGPIGYRALSRNQPAVLGRQLLEEAFRWAVPGGWRETFSQQRPRPALIASHTKEHSGGNPVLYQLISLNTHARITKRQRLRRALTIDDL